LIIKFFVCLEDFKRSLLGANLKRDLLDICYKFAGGNGAGVTPVPIPNTVVKPCNADGTARVTWWESRTLPVFYLGVMIQAR
jgi:hypothetical protein